MPTRYGLARYRASYLIWWLARADSGEPRPRKRTPKQARKELFRLAGNDGGAKALPQWPGVRVHVRPGNLEDVFLELTGRELREE